MHGLGRVARNLLLKPLDKVLDWPSGKNLRTITQQNSEWEKIAVYLREYGEVACNTSLKRGTASFVRQYICKLRYHQTPNPPIPFTKFSLTLISRSFPSFLVRLFWPKSISNNFRTKSSQRISRLSRSQTKRHIFANFPSRESTFAQQ